MSVGTRRSAMKKDPSSLGEGKKNSDARAKEKERIRLEVEAKSEEIRRKDEKARDMKVTSSPSSRQGIDSKVTSHRKEEKDEKSLFSAVPMKVTTTSSSEPTSIDEDLYHRSQPESKNVSKDVSTSSKIAIPLPYSQSTTTKKNDNEKQELNEEESNENTWKKSSTSPPPRPPPLERTISNVSSSVHASVQASLSSSSSEDDEEEEERKGGEREKGGIRKGRRSSSSLLVSSSIHHPSLFHPILLSSSLLLTLTFLVQTLFYPLFFPALKPFFLCEKKENDREEKT